jgi:hypothetical protein
MIVGLPLLGIGLATIALVIAAAIWYLAFSMRSHSEHREKQEAQRRADQPWDSAGERANR